MKKDPTQFQFDCKISLLALRDYLAKFDMQAWREDLGWTVDKGFVDDWVEEQHSEFRKAPFHWFINVDEETQWKFLASIEKRVRLV